MSIKTGVFGIDFNIDNLQSRNSITKPLNLTEKTGSFSETNWTEKEVTNIFMNENFNLDISPRECLIKGILGLKLGSNCSEAFIRFKIQKDNYINYSNIFRQLTIKPNFDYYPFIVNVGVSKKGIYKFCIEVKLVPSGSNPSAYYLYGLTDLILKV